MNYPNPITGRTVVVPGDRVKWLPSGDLGTVSAGCTPAGVIYVIWDFERIEHREAGDPFHERPYGPRLWTCIDLLPLPLTKPGARA